MEYPDGRVAYLSPQSRSNLYSLIKDAKTHNLSIALGAGVSASIGLPTWNRLLKRICYSFLEEWIFKIGQGKSDYNTPPKELSIGFTQGYELFEMENISDVFQSIDFADVTFYVEGCKMNESYGKKMNETFQKVSSLHQSFSADFMKKIMSSELTITAQMIKNRIRKSDWNYLVRKALYQSYEGSPLKLHSSELYNSIISIIKTTDVSTIINYNYDDTLFHVLNENKIEFHNLYEKSMKHYNKNIYYPHGYMPMKGGVSTEIVLSEQDYQQQGAQLDLWTNNIQISTYSTTSCIFLGVSLQDANMRRILNICRSSSKYYHYAFLPTSGDDEVSVMLDALFDADLFRLGIKVIRYPIDNNYEKLPQLLTFIAENTIK
ncbi:MAG: hypothetical protein K0R92_2186 [Lachnospiraceae bacterium]|jgi:hypothetical protein|nr:hypothetical protein [Lachnospiraceae bacterium]MDF2843446.1 hypothetical protein [Herbinix sp.]